MQAQEVLGRLVASLGRAEEPAERAPLIHGVVSPAGHVQVADELGRDGVVVRRERGPGEALVREAEFSAGAVRVAVLESFLLHLESGESGLLVAPLFFWRVFFVVIAVVGSGVFFFLRRRRLFSFTEKGARIF